MENWFSEQIVCEPKQKKINRDVPNQEPLMVLRQEYLSDGDEKGFPWLH